MPAVTITTKRKTSPRSVLRYPKKPKFDDLKDEVVKLASQGIISDLASLQLSKAEVELKNRKLKLENRELLFESDGLQRKFDKYRSRHPKSTFEVN